MIGDNTFLLYKKPDAICADLSAQEFTEIDLPLERFVERYKTTVRTQIESNGLKLRLAKIEDILSIEKFIEGHYKKELIDEVSPYDIYRFIEFGYGVIIETPANDIVGCIFEVGYEAPERPSYSIRLGIHSSQHGKNLGKLLTLYSCLLAMGRGSKIKRGLIDFDNYVQIFIQLNKIGWLLDDFYPDLKGLGTCYKVCLPLDPKGLLTNRIDDKKVAEFIKTHVSGKDYIVGEFDDVGFVADMYSKTSFRTAAFIKSETPGGKNRFLALPKESIGLK
jgi:hypothetical protein